ncbi:Uncharacterized protein TPAR_00569 [Tolypocladium paradoxum]|uniref:Uncharacterized protein n=1 Tax=Tolypocladium paradoxum TaxID=94208 RepID=A0A2S4L9W9_9HYPO|nr:Uncharacterized protein TPAR_00569 [Tolypocladium paradoxum]
MKFTVVILAVATLFSASDACKCIGPNGNNVEATNACCQEAGGRASGGDCPAGQISQRLSRFASCCRNYSTRSDCRCPIGCAKQELEAEREAKGMPPPTEDEVQALVATYEE